MANQTTPAPNPGNHTTNQPPTPREPLITERLLATYFLEIITRVIPGSVFIALYANKFVTKTFTLFHESSLLLGLSLLAGAWLTGLVLDLATFTPGFFLTKVTRRICKSGFLARLCANLLSPTTAPNDRQLSSPTNPNERQFINDQKCSGERILFRAMMTISFLTAICTPSLFSVRAWIFPACKWADIYGIYAMIFFILCWVLAAWPKIVEAWQTASKQPPQRQH